VVNLVFYRYFLGQKVLVKNCISRYFPGREVLFQSCISRYFPGREVLVKSCISRYFPGREVLVKSCISRYFPGREVLVKLQDESDLDFDNEPSQGGCLNPMNVKTAQLTRPMKGLWPVENAKF